MIGSGSAGTDATVARSTVSGGCHEISCEADDNISRAVDTVDSWKECGLKFGMGRAHDTDGLDKACGKYCMADTDSLDKACGARDADSLDKAGGEYCSPSLDRLMSSAEQSRYQARSDSSIE